jgi:hypothetical protein
MPYFLQRLGNICKENRLMNSQWVKLILFFCPFTDNLCTQKLHLVIYTLYSMITYGNLVGVSPRYSTTDFQRLLAKRPTVSPIVVS